MRRLRVLGAVLVMAWWAVLLVPGAEAESPEATGWWAATRITPIPVQGLPVGVDPLQVPSTVPDGGLYVAAAGVLVDGSKAPLGALPDEVPPDRRIPIPPQTVPQEAPSRELSTETGRSALRLYVGNDAAVGDLVLEYDKVQGQAENKLGTVAIQACLPKVVWTPDEGGPIESAPDADCSMGLAYGADEGATLRIPVGGLVRDGMLDVVVMPQPGAAFQAVFKKPGPTSIEVIHYPTSDDGGSGDDPPFFFELDCACPLGEVPFLSTGGIGDLSAAPVDPSVFVPQPPVAGRSHRIHTDRGLIRNTVAELEPWQKGVAAAVLAGLVTVYFFLVRPPGALPLPLGPFAGRRREGDVDPPRGIGRFARPRVGSPPDL